MFREGDRDPRYPAVEDIGTQIDAVGPLDGSGFRAQADLLEKGIVAEGRKYAAAANQPPLKAHHAHGTVIEPQFKAISLKWLYGMDAR